MAVEKKWIRYAIITLSLLTLLFVTAQIALTAAGIVLVPSLTILLNAAIEFALIALFITPAVWLGFAASISRHRGVYITLTVFAALSLLSSIAFLVYESIEFSRLNYYSTSVTAGTVLYFAPGITISKLVCWCLKILLLVALLGVAIAADCSRKPMHPRYTQYGPGYSSMPPEYGPRPLEYAPRPLEYAPRPLEYGPRPLEYGSKRLDYGRPSKASPRVYSPYKSGW